MTSMAPPAPSARQRVPTDYSEILGTVQAMGLFDRRYLYYAVKIGLVLTALVAVWVGFFLVGNSWLQLLLAAVLGVVLTQCAFLSHDALHRQVFRSGSANDWLGMVLASLISGMSSAWWTNKHSKHHGTPNQIGKDPDIEPGILAFYPNATMPKNRVTKFLVERQGWWFFPILTMEALNLHIQGLIALTGRAPMKHRWIQITFVGTRLAGIVTVLLVFLPPGKAAAFLGVQLAVFGVYMGCSFAPSHKGMPIVPADARVDFFRRQVLMSRNVPGTRWLTFLLGGLNFQIEHHLFPSMPRPNLRRAQASVRAFCQQQSITYTEKGLFASYGIVVRYLNRVGLRDRDVFQCPVVANLRPLG